MVIIFEPLLILGIIAICALVFWWSATDRERWPDPGAPTLLDLVRRWRR